jgi:chorismate mutase
MDNLILTLAKELGRSETHVENVVNLIDEGATIPFIARYRKELHGSMDDQLLRTLADRLQYLRNLAQRKQEVLGGRITNFAHVSYDLHLIGDLDSNYSVSCILSPQLEAEALERHLSYTRLYFKDTDTEEDKARQIEEATRDFYAYDYNYRSSTASVIHRKYKILCGVSGADRSKDDRTPEEAAVIRHLEHQRWNAFVRSDGFVLPEVGRGRDKLAKTHPCLVPFLALPYEEQIKDDD